LRMKTLLLVAAVFVANTLAGCYSVEQSTVERGYRWIRRGQTATALSTFDVVLKKSPSSVLGHLGRADALFESKNDREAVAEYDRTLALYLAASGASPGPPGEKTVVGHRVLSYQNRGLAFPFGIEAYNYLRRAGAFHALALSAGAVDEDSFQKALADYDQVLKLAPTDAAAKEQRDQLLKKIQPVTAPAR
ncbi:MAG: hypothetical protein ABIY47_21205, partial [Opitutaceae bacterium]